MAEASFNPVKFISTESQEFGATVRKRVNEYFKQNEISRKGDYRFWLKVVVLPMIYLVPFALILANLFSGSLLIFYGLWIVMGIGLAGCGLGLMHDFCHGSVSKKKSVNNFFGEVIMYISAGSATNWKIQHNVLHHSYTNIDGYDEDIDPGGVMRFSPHQPLKPIYKYQIYYAWFLYGLMTFFWATFKDFASISRYNKLGLLKTQNTTYAKELAKLIVQKVLYYSLFIVLPILLLDVAWWHVVLGWFTMHFLAGLILACIFQPAHVIPDTEYPLPDADLNVEGDKVIHQMMTTANFAPSNRILSWYVGGLNYQIEHHLFPDVCHVHYRKLSKIVKATAAEFGLPYISEPTFFGALVNHGKMLYQLSR
ncbi:MAG: acyl-CoA desaturase [Cyclobacteriaceae bacterium]